MNKKVMRLSLIMAAAIIFTTGLKAQQTDTEPELPRDMTLIDEKIVAEDYWYVERAIFCKDGTIVCPSFLNEQRCRAMSSSVLRSLLNDDMVIRVFISRDKGETWSVQDTYVQPFNVSRGGKKVRIETPAGAVGILYAFPGEMSDGSYIGLGGNIVNHLLNKKQLQLPYITTFRRFKSLDDLLAGKYQDEFPAIDIPDLAFQRGDSEDLYTGNIETKPIELANGDWIIAMSGRFKQDTIRVPYHEWDSYQFRNWVCVSHDKGRSWQYLATIGDPEKDKLPELAEGYNETELLKLDGDTILAAMRTGANPDSEGTLKKYTYLAASFSGDGGKTWQSPKPIAPYGVSPRLLRMQNGIIVCTSGRPGVFAVISRDGGKTWTEPQWVTKYHTKWGQCSTGYTAIGEQDPGVLTLLYDDVIRNPAGEIVRHVIKLRRYGVR